MRGQLFQIDAFNHGMARKYWQQCRNAKFYRFFNHNIHLVLNRRKGQPQIGAVFLRAELPLQPQCNRPFIDSRHLRQPFAVAAVENGDAITLPADKGALGAPEGEVEKSRADGARQAS